MSTGKPLAIVLAGTQPHIPLIENLEARGYYVLLVDYLESPPAKRVADEHSRVSTLDMDAVLALARERRAALVIAACVDRANVTAAYVAETLGLPAPYGFTTAALVADKLKMKQRLASLGVPTAAFEVVRGVADVDRLSMPFPVVAKPIDTGGSKGVRKAADVEQLRQAVAQAFRITRAAELLVEEFLEGVEVSADCLVQDGEVRILMLRERFIERSVGGAVLSAYASVSPARISAAARDGIERATTDIARGFGLRTTPLLVQFMVDGDDVRVIEFAPRVGGGLNFRLVLLKTGRAELPARPAEDGGRPRRCDGRGLPRPHDRASRCGAWRLAGGLPRLCRSGLLRRGAPPGQAARRRSLRRVLPAQGARGDDRREPLQFRPRRVLPRAGQWSRGTAGQGPRGDGSPGRGGLRRPQHHPSRRLPEGALTGPARVPGRSNHPRLLGASRIHLRPGVRSATNVSRAAFRR